MPSALPFTQIPYTANGNVSPRRFIVGVAASPQLAVQATGVALPIMGVSYNKTRFPPGSASNDGYNAIAGEMLSYHSAGEVCSIDVGETAITDITIPLTSDSAGKALPVDMTSNTTLTWVAALAMDTAEANGEVRALLLSGFYFHPTLS